MKILSSISLGVALLFASFAPATAVTIGEGQVFCESQNLLADDSGCDLGGNADFGQTATTTLTFAGTGTIHGFVADDTGTTGNFADVVNLVILQTSTLMFDLFNIDQGFLGTASLTGPGGFFEDGLFGFGDPTAELSASLVLAAGTYVFNFNAANPDGSVRTETEYKINVAPVPLPASGLLILGGLGALGALRRRKARA